MTDNNYDTKHQHACLVDQRLSELAEKAKGSTIMGVEVTRLSREGLLGAIYVIGEQLKSQTKLQNISTDFNQFMVSTLLEHIGKER